MKFIDINKREHTFELNTKFGIKDETNSRSEPQFKLGKLLSKIFGRSNVFEDYPLPGCGNLSWDFWIPHRQLAFEFHGRQHFEYVKYFHETHAGFKHQQQGDKRKAEIAGLNKVTLIVLSDTDFKEWTEEELKKRINEAI